MYRQPIFTIARISTSFMLRSSGLNATITKTIVSSVFGLISQIYSKYGFVSSIQAIYTLFKFLRNRESINSSILSRVFINTHPEISTLFLQYIVPNWTIISQYRYRLLFSLFSLSSATVLTLIRPIWFLRFILGSILSSVGILWHETLSTYDYLKAGSLYVVHLLDDYGFKIPIPSAGDIPNHEDNHSSFYTIIGVLLLGTIGIALSIILLEYYIPPIKDPVINYTYWDRIYNFLHLEYLNVWFLTVNQALYEYYPPIYDYLFTPMNHYLISPTWKYGVSMPFNYSYDYLFHPCADGIRYIYDFIYYSIYSRPDNFTLPPSSPITPSDGDSIKLNDERMPSSMTDSTSTIIPDRIVRSESRNPFTNNTYGMFTNVGQSSKTKIEDLDLPNPFND